jgi:hypothetical protein
MSSVRRDKPNFARCWAMFTLALCLPWQTNALDLLVTNDSEFL